MVFSGLRLSTKVSLGIGLILVLLLLSSVAAVVYHESHEFNEDIGKTARQVLTVLKSLHTQAMLNRGDKVEGNPVIKTLDGTFAQLSENSEGMTLWLVMGPKVLAFQEKMGFQKLGPPRDGIDDEALATGLPVARLVGNHTYRFTEPVILGQGVATDALCFECHAVDMGLREGEVIGAYSIALDVRHRREEFVATAWASLFIGILLAAVVSAFSIFLLNRLAGAPIVRMTGIMNRLAGGDAEVEIPIPTRRDEIGDMMRAIGVFKENAIKRRQAETALRNSEEHLRMQVAELRDNQERLETQGAEIAALADEVAIARDLAEKASRAKSTFLYEMSHELRTPLNAIMGFSELMKTRVFGPVGDARYEEYVDHIHASGEHLLALINDVLDLSKVEAGKLEPFDEIIDVAKMVDASLGFIRESAAVGKVELDTEIPDALPRLRADQRMVKQILLNLLSNAVKFTPEQGRVTVRVLHDGDGSLLLSVADTGIGIAAEDIPKVVTLFHQVDSPFARKHKGTGLGLHLVKELAEVHGGGLDIDSEPGKGTTATVRFPPERVVTDA